MKRHIIMLLTALLFLWTGCSDDRSDDPTPNNGTQIEISDASKSPNFSTEGGQISVEFTAKSNWTVSIANTRADNWCTVHPLSGKAGKATLTITTTANESYDERNAVITIQSGTDKQTLTVIQKQKNALIINSNKVEMKKEGGELVIEVKANISFTSSIEKDIDWITAATNTRGLTDTTLKFNIAPNTSGYKRQADITVTDGTLSEHVTVYQEGDVPQLIVTANRLSFDHTGDSLKVEVNSNIDYEMTLPDTSWITEDKERNQSTHTLYFYVNPNNTYDHRSASILFKDKHSELADTIKVMQLQKDALVFSDDMVRVPGNENRLKIRFRRNIDFKVTVNTNWITQVENPETRALKTDSVYFVILANPEYEERSCHITFSSLDGKVEQKITVIQEKKETDETETDILEILKRIYEDTDGEHWNVKYHNWMSDRPIDQWQGVGYENGILTLNLNNFGLKGYLSIKNCPILKHVTVGSNPQLKGVTVDNCNNLTELNLGTSWIYDEQDNLEHIKISRCDNLEKINLVETTVKDYFITECPKLKTSILSSSDVGNLLVQGILVEKDMSWPVYNTKIGIWTIENVSISTEQNFSWNISSTVDDEKSVIENFVMKNINCPFHTFVFRIPILKTSITQAHIWDLDGIQGEEIEYRECTFYGPPSSKDISASDNCRKLTIADCNNVERFFKTDGSLTELSIHNCPSLKTIICSNNQLTSLTLHNLSTLSTVDCRSNKICSVIPKWMEELHSFKYDARFIYHDEPQGENWYEDTKNGWWHENEPYPGYILK